MSSLFLMVTITDRRSTDAFLQLYQQRGVDVNLRTVGSGTAVRETLATLGLEKTEKAVLLAVVTENTWKAVRTDLRRKMRHRRAGHRHCIHGAAEQHRRQKGADVPHPAPAADIEGGEHLEGYPLRTAAGNRPIKGHTRHHYGVPPAPQVPAVAR